MDRGRPGFGQGFTCPALLRIPPETHSFRIRGSHALWRSFPEASPTNKFSTNSLCGPTTPQMWFGLLPVRSPLLGESLLISVPELLRWFTSLSVAPVHYIFMHSGNSKLLDYSIRTSGGHRICAPHPGFSQLITSFFAFESQGIRLLPFPTSFFLRTLFFSPIAEASKPVV